MMTFVGKEIPTGDIDGVNTTFIFLNQIDVFDDLWIDGAIYTDFTIQSDKKTIILTDAPVVSIFGDYNTGVTSTPVDTECTFGDIKQKVWDLLGQRSTSTNFSDSIVSDEINNRSIEIWKGKVVNKLNPNQYFRTGGMFFRDKVTNLRFKSGGKLSAGFDIGDTSLTMADTTNLLGSGFVEIGGDTIQYTSKTATTLDGVSGQTIDHLATEQVIQLYQMPVDMHKPEQVEKIIQGTDLRKVDIPLDNDDNACVYFQIIRPTNLLILLKIVGLDDDDLVKVSYPKKYQKMSLNTDSCPFPDEHGINTVAYIVAGSLGYDKGMPNSQQHLNSGYTSLQTMYGDYNNEIEIIKQKLKPKPYKMSSIRRFNSIRRR